MGREIDELTDDSLSLTGFMEAPIGIMMLSNRRILRVNLEIEQLFGHSRLALEGQSVRLLYPSSVDYEKTGERWERWLESGPRYEDERFMQHSSGEIVWMRARGRTMTPQEPFKFMVWTFEKLEEGRNSASLLTPKERVVARHLANGMTSKQIGQLIGISPRTVEVHRASIMRKMNVRNTAELVAHMIIER